MVLGHDVSKGKRTSDIQISVDVTFDSMLLSNATLCGLKNSGFHKPSPIQLHGIPLGKCGFDLFLEAKSGTGKTAVFTVIALENIDLNKGLQVLILAPTREIAAQISDVIKEIGSSYEGLNVVVVMGGLPLHEDILKLQNKVHILVGSPGRVKHLIKDKHIQVSTVRLFVLDEADKLMDKSFQDDIGYIFSALPQQKQVIMSSATYPHTLKDVMENYVQKAQRICPDTNSILLGIEQLVTIVSSNVNVVRQTRLKFEELLKILSNREFKQCLIFCNYQSRVMELCTMLLREKWPAEQLHGLLEQNDRLDALKTLQSYKCRILVCTDIAARGIDASNVDLVVNFEHPQVWPTYLHRIGRAGRYGSYGIAITILSKGEVNNFKEMVKSIKVPINLHSLWNDNAFELCDFDTNIATSPLLIKSTEHLETLGVAVKCEASELEIAEIENDNDEDNCEELLDLSKLKKENSFVNLFDSVKKPMECKIESFNDLMASFNNHDPNNNGAIDKIQDNKTDKKCLDSVVNSETDPTVKPDSNIDKDLKVDKQSEEEKVKSSVNGLVCHNYKEKQVNKYYTEEHITQNKYIKNDNVSINKGESAKLNTNSQALKDAGLPTSFGSSKYSNRNLVNEYKQSRFNKNMDDKERVHGVQYKAADNRNKCIQARNKISEIHCMKSSTETNACDDNFSYKSCLRTRPSNNMQYKNSNKRFSQVDVLNNSRKINYDSEGSVSSNEINHNRENVDYQKYMSWYKNLKAHMKQVEISLYVDALSKVNQGYKL